MTPCRDLNEEVALHVPGTSARWCRKRERNGKSSRSCFGGRDGSQNRAVIDGQNRLANTKLHILSGGCSSTTILGGGKGLISSPAEKDGSPALPCSA